MDNPIFLGLAVLELRKLLMYETYYDKSRQYFWKKYIQLLYLDTDSFVLSVNTKDFIKSLTILDDLFISALRVKSMNY